jgi:hypothetical protein
MLGWIVRVLFVVAASITALLVSRESLGFSLVQTFVAIVLIVACVGIAAVWTRGQPRAGR